MKILIYIEPHPIRGTAFEFLNVARRFARLTANATKSGTVFRMAVSRPIAEVLGPVNGLAPLTPGEQVAIDRFAGPWDDERIAEWLSLVDGDGPAMRAQEVILDRLLEEFPADCLVIWSENGAARAAGQARGIPVIHCELGPTRFPFYETVYCDLAGTNGNAALRQAVREALIADDAPGPGGAALCSIRRWYGERAPADAPSVFIPLQLADDLNTLRHSDFADPTDFLRRTLPDLAEQGVRAVIKGHPGAGLRPYNQAKQAEALAWLRDWRARTGADVALLDPRNGPRRTIEALRASLFTVTINSSVGFESMLLGTPTALKGVAIYDAGGLLQERAPDFGPDADAARREEGARFCDRLTSVYLRGHLLPAFRFWHDDLLTSLCRDAVGAGADKTRALTAVADAEAALKGHPLWRAPVTGPNPGRARVGSPIGLNGGVRITATEIRLTDEAEERALPRTATFRVCIDHCEDVGVCGRVVGWAFERETGQAPAYVLALAEGRVVAVATPEIRRALVAAAWPEVRQPVGFELAIPPEISVKDVGLVLVSADDRAALVPGGALGGLAQWVLRLQTALRGGWRRR